MYMSNINIEKRGTRYWVVLADTKRFGIQQIMYEGITKKSCQEYISREKKMYRQAMNRLKLARES